MKLVFKNISGPKRIYGIIVLLVCLAILAVFLILQQRRENPIQIAAILSLSGPALTSGEAVRDGMLLAIEELNAWGGIQGRKLKLLVADSQTDPETAKQAFERIEASSQPLVYVTTTSSVAMAIAPLAEAHHVVLIGLVATTPHLTDNSAWVFKYYTTPETEVAPIMEMLRTFKITSLGILYLNDDYGFPVFQLLQEEVQKNGGIATGMVFETGQTDFDDAVTQLKELEAIYIVGFQSHLKNIVVQLRKAEFPGMIMTSNVIDPGFVKSHPELNGVYCAAPVIYNPSFVFARQVADTFQKHYGKPFNHFSANGYDTVKLLAGLLKNPPISRATIRNRLEEEFIYVGILGDIVLRSGEHDIRIPLYPAQIVKGEIRFRR
jgi:branched-chain amino acid transport system substrate-binding protein